jgi:CheY-like chemotaxis protein
VRIMRHPGQRKKPILLVEDSLADPTMARRAFDELGIGDRLICSSAPPEALAYLKDESTERPCIILLGVDGSGTGGLATLRTIKQDEQLQSIPVIVLGPTDDHRMVDESFGLGAAGYMARLADHARFAATMRTLYEYWSLNELPI